MCDQNMQEGNQKTNNDSPKKATTETNVNDNTTNEDIQRIRDMIQRNTLNRQTLPVKVNTDEEKNEEENAKEENTKEENTEEKKKKIDPKLKLVFTGEDLMNLPIDKTPHLWEPIMFKEGLVALTGSSDVGKSSFLRDLALAIVLKEPTFLNHPLNATHGKVIYYTTEENQASIATCLRKQKERIGKKDLTGLKYIFSMEKPWNVITNEMKKAPVDAVIIDCFADIFEGNLNDNGDVRRYLQEISELSVGTNTLFILLHHNGKRTEHNAPSKNSMIGSQGFEAKVRLVLEIRKDGDTTRSLWMLKGNHLPESMKKQGMQLNFDENQHFTYAGKCDYVSTSINNKFLDSKEIMVAHINVLLSQDPKISQDKIQANLKNKFPKSAPSKGTVCKWVKELKNKQLHKAA